MYYFDNAATTIDKPECVAKALYDALINSNYGNPSRGAHSYSLDALEKLYEVRSAICDFLGGDCPSHVVLTPNITYALNLMISSLIEPCDHVITTDSEHNSVLRPLYHLAQKGLQLSFLPIDQEGTVLSDHFEKMIQSNTKALIIQHASNVSGNIHAIAHFAELCYKHGIFCIIDGAQTVGCIDIDLKAIGYPLIFCFTGHKSLHAPQGTGGILIIGDYPFKQVFSGGSGMNSFSPTQPYTVPELFEYGTVNLHSNIALIEAIRQIQSRGMDEIEKKLDFLCNRFYQGVKDLHEVKLYGNFTKKRVPLLSLNIGDISSVSIGDLLWNRYEIAVRPGFHCAPRYHNSLKTELQGQVRFSFSTVNTIEEIDYAVKAIHEICGLKRSLL